MDRDNKIQDLINTISDMYAFMREAKPVEKIKSHAKILAAMRNKPRNALISFKNMPKPKVLVCFLSILGLLTPDLVCSIGIRAIKNRLLSVDDVIQGYRSKFADLQSNFERRAILQTEIAVVGTESTIRSIDITVTRVLDVTSGAGGRFYRIDDSFGCAHDLCYLQRLWLL